MLTRSLPLIALLLSLLSACASQPPARLEVEVLERLPHDSNAFTQGLLLADGALYESTGLYGRSTLREVDLETGEVRRLLRLDPSLFGEGLALVEDRLIQLTWRAGRALVYDIDTFEQVGSFDYDGEGWGLCFDGVRLWMSDGSASLVKRDPQTFEIEGEIEVTLDGEPVTRLNELECVGEYVYANVWQTDEIVRVEKESGRVDAVIDASGLLSPQLRAVLSPDAVLNGIAYDPGDEVFFVTGKLWPATFVVRFR